MYSCGPPHMDVQEWDDQHEPTYSNYVRTQDVTLKTCRRRWMIGRNGERGSGISALAAWHDDDDDIYIYICIYIYITWWCLWPWVSCFSYLLDICLMKAYSMKTRVTDTTMSHTQTHTHIYIYIYKYIYVCGGITALSLISSTV